MALSDPDRAVNGATRNRQHGQEERRSLIDVQLPSQFDLRTQLEAGRRFSLHLLNAQEELLKGMIAAIQVYREKLESRQ